MQRFIGRYYLPAQTFHEQTGYTSPPINYTEIKHTTTQWHERPQSGGPYSANGLQKSLSQEEFNTLITILDNNRVANDLSRHLARGAAVNTIYTAAVTGHLTEAQKPQAAQAAAKELAFLNTLSSNSAALSTIPVEARRSGFDRDICHCLVIIRFAVSAEEAVPIVLPYANSSDPEIKQVVGNILKRAHYTSK